MKLTNHTKQGQYYLEDGTVTKGTISMTPNEWEKSFKWLFRKYMQAKIKGNTYTRDCLANIGHDNGHLFSVGVHATQLLVKHNKLSNYKDQNYAIRIK